MVSGRTLVVLGLVGVGLYVLRKGTAAASSVHGLGEAATPAQAEALAAKAAAGAANIVRISQMLIVTPPMPQVGPRRVLGS
jgi:hypothetical protein